jgi:alpha-N-arabinofuranosidase
MANVAQLINNLHSLFLASEDKFVATPNFHVFEMYAAHCGGRSLRTEFNVPRTDGTRQELPGLAGSASLHDRRLVLTVTNTHATEPSEVQIRIRNATIRRGKARVLTGPDIHAHNTFAQPLAVQPHDAECSLRDDMDRHRFPPASITRLELELG